MWGFNSSSSGVTRDQDTSGTWGVLPLKDLSFSNGFVTESAEKTEKRAGIGRLISAHWSPVRCMILERVPHSTGILAALCGSRIFGLKKIENMRDEWEHPSCFRDKISWSKHPTRWIKPLQEYREQKGNISRIGNWLVELAGFWAWEFLEVQPLRHRMRLRYADDGWRRMNVNWKYKKAKAMGGLVCRNRMVPNLI